MCFVIVLKIFVGRFVFVKVFVKISFEIEFCVGGLNIIMFLLIRVGVIFDFERLIG